MKSGVVYIEHLVPSKKNIREALKLRKQLGLRDIVFSTDDPQICYAVRMIVKSYRHLFVSDKASIAKNRNSFREVSMDITEDFHSHDKRVRNYLMDTSLGTMSVLEGAMSERRLRHVKAVADLSVKIARSNGLDERKAYMAGLWHDIAKKLSADELKYYMQLYYPEYLDYNVNIWHQYVGEILLRKIYQIRDKDVLKAVKHHCLGDDSSPLSMVIYCADKLDPSRGYDSSSQIELCCRDLKAGFRLVHKEQHEYLRKEGVLE